MRTGVHLTFNGNCEEAFTFYEQALGARIAMMLSYAKSAAAAQTPPEWLDKIVHANIMIGQTMLHGADVRPEQYERPQGFFVLLDVGDEASAARSFQALASGGVIKMPLQRTFWSPAFGALVDRFGTPWEVSAPGG